MVRTSMWSASIAFLGLSSAYAHAGIICHEGYQVVQGREISTPYCNDNYVAAVARKHGMDVSDSAVRNSPSVKDEVCRWAGHDPRIKEYCNSVDGADPDR